MRLILRAIPFWLWALTMGACLTAQDDENEQPEIKPETSRDKMAYALFRRLVHPMLQWRQWPQGDPMPLEAERHFCLLIEPEDDRLDPAISFKVTLNYGVEALRWEKQYEGDPCIECPESYLDRKLGSIRMLLWERMTLAFEQGFEGPMETFSIGSPVWLRCPTEHSEPTKYRKEDVIRRN